MCYRHVNEKKQHRQIVVVWKSEELIFMHGNIFDHQKAPKEDFCAFYDLPTVCILIFKRYSMTNIV